MCRNKIARVHLIFIHLLAMRLKSNETVLPHPFCLTGEQKNLKIPRNDRFNAGEGKVR